MVFKQLYPKDYTLDVSTRVSNALLVGQCAGCPRFGVALCETDVLGLFSGAVLGQVSVGLLCDRIGRKAALVATTLLIVIGATLGTAAHGAHGSVQGLFWFLTIARGITGVVSMTSRETSEHCAQNRKLCRAWVESIRLLQLAPARQPMRK